jgi:DNA-binding transcriptional LysR family regulator
MQPYHWSDLELRHLVALQAIAEAGSFWAAADRLDCSASALSQQIANLERRVGHRLAERSRGRRTVSLTEPGRLLLRHADAIAARLRAAHADLVAFGEGAAGKLRIGTYQSVGSKILPRLLRRFAADWPGVELQLTEEAEDQKLLKMVLQGELDLTITVFPLPEGPFEGVQLMRDPYVLMVANDAPLARAGSAALAQLGELSLIGFASCRSYTQIEAYLRTQGVVPNYVFRSDDNGIVQGLVGAGVGAALVPRLSVDARDEAIRIFELPNIPPRILALAWHRDRYRSPAAIAFTKRAQEVCAAFAQPEPRVAQPA